MEPTHHGHAHSKTKRENLKRVAYPSDYLLVGGDTLDGALGHGGGGDGVGDGDGSGGGGGGGGVEEPTATKVTVGAPDGRCRAGAVDTMPSATVDTRATAVGTPCARARRVVGTLSRNLSRGTARGCAPPGSALMG